MARDFSKPFYRSKQWQKIREYILKRDNYLCIECGNVAEEIHHIIHLRPDNIDDVAITLGEDNLQSLCRDCHFNKHRRDRGIVHVEDEYKFDEGGYLILESKNKIK